MVFTPDKVPGIVAAYRKLEPFRSDMAIIVGCAAPQGEVTPENSTCI